MVSDPDATRRGLLVATHTPYGYGVCIQIFRKIILDFARLSLLAICLRKFLSCFQEASLPQSDTNFLSCLRQ